MQAGAMILSFFLFPFLETYTTVNLLKECYKVQHGGGQTEAIRGSIDPPLLLYVRVTVSEAQAPLLPGTYDAVTAIELYTVIPVRQLGGGSKHTPPLSRTN